MYCLINGSSCAFWLRIHLYDFYGKDALPGWVFQFLETCCQHFYLFFDLQSIPNCPENNEIKIRETGPVVMHQIIWLILHVNRAMTNMIHE